MGCSLNLCLDLFDGRVHEFVDVQDVRPHRPKPRVTMSNSAAVLRGVGGLGNASARIARNVSLRLLAAPSSSCAALRSVTSVLVPNHCTIAPLAPPHWRCSTEERAKFALCRA